MKQPRNIIDSKSWVVHKTQLPGELCDMIMDYFVDKKQDIGTAVANTGYRRCGIKWADPGNWVGPFVWRYIEEANESIFKYDLSWTHMTEIHQIEYRPGHYYHWHDDDSIDHHIQYAPPSFQQVNAELTEYVRKLSFSLQLSHPDEYTGGDVQIINDSKRDLLTVPKERGTLCIFDSRTRHRVKPVKTGKRFVLVGWVLGPRWK
ncbi:MAG: 2OG-Fe(II) oxygenase [Candidatus Nanopelagicaceae bacterium]